MYYDIHTHIYQEKDIDIFSIFNFTLEKLPFLRELLPASSKISLGIHPWTIKEQTLNEEMDILKKNISSPEVLAIGECGLDKLSSTPFQLQKKAFEAQVALSEKIKKPLIIHCVKMADELIAIKKQMHPEQTWIIHGFRGKPEQMSQLADQGFYLSFGEKFNEESLKKIPLNRIFLETDEGKASIKDIYRHVAKTRNYSEEDLKNQIKTNFFNVFYFS